MMIAEVSKKFELSQDTLRYYERIGLIPNVNRNKSGIRDYTDEDCKWIEFVKCMRNAGLPIEVLIKYLDLFQQGDNTHNERKELLVKQRNMLARKIEEMQETLERLNYKIENYDQRLMAKELELLNLGNIAADVDQLLNQVFENFKHYVKAGLYK